MKNRQEIENRITLFMTNIRKGLSYDANVNLLANDIEKAMNGIENDDPDSKPITAEEELRAIFKFDTGEYWENNPNYSKWLEKYLINEINS
jgi:hypothetical protein